MENISSESLWAELTVLEFTLRPTSYIIGKLESDTCCLSDIYRLFLDLKAQWQQNPTLNSLLMDRWNSFSTPSMGFAYFLDPKSRAGEGMFEDDLYDNAVELEDFILSKKNLSSSRADVELEISLFVEAMKNPSLKAQRFIEHCATPMTYWQQVGATKFPILFQVAQIVFSIPTSQAASERVWSIYDFILTKRSNRMTPQKVT